MTHFLDFTIVSQISYFLEKEAVLVDAGGKPLQIDGKSISNKSVEEGILSEAKPHDAIIVGATRKSVYPQILFGSIPENISRQARQPVIVVKYHHPVAALVGRVMGS